ADLRGHGRSPGRRGVVRRYDDLLADVRATLDWAAKNHPTLPCFLLGHSNGGLLALWLAQGLEPEPVATNQDGRSRRHPAGLILSNPSVQIIAPVPPAKRKVGQVLLYYAPWLTLSGKLDASLLTRDPASQREHETDPLRHSR